MRRVRFELDRLYSYKTPSLSSFSGLRGLGVVIHPFFIATQ
jgi:hypothetical protein